MADMRRKMSAPQLYETYIQNAAISLIHILLLQLRIYRQYRKETGDTKPTLIASTASPYKFAGSVMSDIDPENAKLDDTQLIDLLSKKSGTSIPNAIKGLFTAPVIHKGECDKDEMKDKVKEFLAI